jgi:phosphatidylglycerophosphatase A
LIISARRPDFAFLIAHPAHVVALSFGAGLVPWAPGTFGTLAAFPLYWLLDAWLTPLAVAFTAVPLFVVGMYACATTARNLGVKDPGAICWDETVAFLPLIALTHDSLLLQAIAFAAFRLFDILKPFPIRQLDQALEGGFGIMLDDAVAAMYAYVVIVVLVLANARLGFLA